MDEEYNTYILKNPNYGKVSKDTRLSTPKLTFSGNFTAINKQFDINSLERRASMKRDILSAVMKRTESRILSQDGEKVSLNENPMYEDPRDVIEKPAKPPRKRNVQGIAVTSSPKSKDKSLLREQKRKLTKKYESLITTLMDRCEDNVIQISEKDSQIAKLKEKLKTVLEYNRLFAEENDQLKSQYTTLVKYVEECKRAVREERDSNRALEERCTELEERVKQYELPNRDRPEPTAVPLVEVCMSCSSRQIILNQAREQNARLQKDMQALKDVLYRLNVQLSRYQEKVRTSAQTLGDKADHIYKPTERSDALDSLITASLGYRTQETATTDNETNKTDEHTHGRLVDLSGLLSAQALAPLFDAYQENLQEKDSLILDYEKQFENINKKSKQIIEENKSLSEKVASLEEDLLQARQSYKKAVVEKETADIERATLLERAERAEAKLKEVYELYEDKMAAMMRDYETVHREYFTVRNALEASEGKMAALDAFRFRTVPADLHERRLDHCKRLLEELKHQYSMETERKTEQLANAQQQLKVLAEKHNKLCEEHEGVKQELKAALKNVKLYRKAAVIFRQRVRAATARAVRARRPGGSPALKQALDALENIKKEIKVVKARAYTSLEELERRIVQQERRAAHAHAQHRRELERASLALEHKEGIIRNLIDKVADVEEVRLSQTNTSRLQGIVTDSDSSPSDKAGKQATVKLVPGPGGYFQEKEGRRRKS
ncbi:protein Cep89 homolog isoform X2 [Amyelois transitella]|uniref:protein Cep89 homolog isoform X2 n=1 Tax=Amyelois transitella TaxID=680683 RepID=UPI00067DD735|nr:protein Cep89 homolog isoform X2 [Amyelois transitella]